jgi:biotin transport system substrate-specific component
MAMTETPATPSPVIRRSPATDIALIAAFAALIAVCAIMVGIPVGGAGVDITLQTFGVILAGVVLGPVRGFLANALYLLLGAIGLPVFAGHTAGLAPFTGNSAGYLWSFPIVAALAGLLVQYVARQRRTSAIVVFLCCVPAMALNHLCGVVGMKLFYDIPWHTAFSYDAPFWLGDTVKILVVALVAAEVHRAFPQLLARRAKA